MAACFAVIGQYHEPMWPRGPACAAMAFVAHLATREQRCCWPGLQQLLLLGQRRIRCQQAPQAHDDQGSDKRLPPARRRRIGVFCVEGHIGLITMSVPYQSGGNQDIYRPHYSPRAIALTTRLLVKGRVETVRRQDAEDRKPEDAPRPCMCVASRCAIVIAISDAERG